MNDFYFVWISLIKGLDINTFIKLIYPIKYSLKDFYQLTKNSEELILYLKKNNIFISNYIFNQLTNSNLKEKSYNLHKFISNNNIKIITIFSEEYKNIFKEKFIPVFYLYGNEELLNNKKYYVYSEKNSKKILNIESSFKSYIENSKNILVEKYNDISNKNNRIYVGDYLDLINFKNNKTDNLYLFCLYDKKLIIPEIIDKLIVVNAKYRKEIVNMVDVILKYGKDVAVVPNELFNSNSYFSNYLIYEGANIIISYKDL